MKNLNNVMFHWSSEAYNFGITFRKYYKLPRFIPLPFYSDHGVLPGGIIDNNIIVQHIPKSIFLTFSPSITSRQREIPSLQILGTLHPWVFFKEEMNLVKREQPEYILFFPMHTLPGFKILGMNDDLSLKYLNENTSKNLAKIVCLHWNDYASGRKNIFENNGYKVVTIGDPFDDDYLEKFYELAAGAKFAITESWTSAVAYLIDFGVPCTIIQREVEILSENKPGELFGKSHSEWSLAVKKAEDLFALYPPVISEEQTDFVRQELGYQYRELRDQNRRAIFIAYYQILPKWLVRKSITQISNLYRKLRPDHL